ncbi:hypothetical protein CDL12_12663 [Handroanthus impetiginosus]|uniref:Uncharacterized protein n=1 Tax=Handroanthus impetiginosus TaxID=429701 RepID=A0A2G9HB28_9LAMI|nr:hypothetical protein CDL12_12663 [Handroanthus impetiginosus]
MGWSYPEISLEDLMKLIINFTDMLILASGYQSTGRLAHWDSHNIKRSFQWAVFLENVAKGLTSSSDYRDCVKELNAALSELKSSPHFPQQGLAHLSCSTLGRARDLLLTHLIQTLPLRDSHLKAIMAATVETDFNKLQRIHSDCLDVYIDKLMRIPSKSLNLSVSRNFTEESKISSHDAGPSGEHVNWVDGDFSVSAIQQLGTRQLAVSCLSAVENGLQNLWKTIEPSMCDELGNISNSRPINHSAGIIAEQLPVSSVVWNHWKLRSLSYMLDKRTIRLLSGASLICSMPEGQWSQMLERLNISAEGDNLCETIELLLLGRIADKWSSIIEHLMSVSYETHTITRLFHEVFNLPWRKSQKLFLNEEKNVVHYLEVLLSRQLNQLWKLSPVVAAVAIPSRSQLFRSYLHELEGQFRENSLATRCCSCTADSLEHRECRSL